MSKSSNHDFTQMSIAERLRWLAEDGWGSAANFSIMMKLPYRTLQNYLRGERDPNAKALKKIGENGLINVDWIVTGRGYPYVADYPRLEWMDAFIVKFLPEIIELCLDKDDKTLSVYEKINLLGYLGYLNYCGIRDALKILSDRGLGGSYDELLGKAHLLNELTAAERKEALATLAAESEADDAQEDSAEAEVTNKDDV